MSLFCPDDRSRIFGIPPGADFSEILAKGLDERLAGQPPEELARIDIFTNSERARARIVEVFSRSGARLLPRVRLLTGLANLPELDLPPPPGNDTELARQLLAMRLVRALIEAEPGLAAKSAGFHLARTITALLDEMQSADLSPDALRELDIGPHASHWEGALKFLNFMMDPQNVAAASNYVNYANGNKESQKYLDKAVLDDPAIYPDQATMDNLYTVTAYPPKVQRIVTRLWTKVKSGT